MKEVLRALKNCFEINEDEKYTSPDLQAAVKTCLKGTIQHQNHFKYKKVPQVESIGSYLMKPEKEEQSKTYSSLIKEFLETKTEINKTGTQQSN